jgi:radical SAM superfamily enzyme YgiQ (UPF0313 family)
MNNRPQYLTVENKPIACSFCGASVHGKITEQKSYSSKEIIKECRWVCARCGNLVKVGIVK